MTIFTIISMTSHKLCLKGGKSFIFVNRLEYETLSEEWKGVFCYEKIFD